MRNLNFNGESTSESYTPTAQTSAAMPSSEGFFSPEFRGDFGAGLLDLHAMDDTELLSEVCLEDELGWRLFIVIPISAHREQKDHKFFIIRLSVLELHPGC